MVSVARKRRDANVVPSSSAPFVLAEVSKKRALLISAAARNNVPAVYMLSEDRRPAADERIRPLSTS